MEHEWTVEEAKEAIEEVIRTGLLTRRLIRYQMEPRVRPIEINQDDELSDEDEDETAAAENRTINLDDSENVLNMNIDRRDGLNRLLMAIEVANFTIGDKVYQVMQLIETAQIPLIFLRTVTYTELKYIFAILPNIYSEWMIRICLFKYDDFSIAVRFFDTREQWLTVPKCVVTSYLINRRATRNAMLENTDSRDQAQEMCRKFSLLPYSHFQRLTSIGYEKNLAARIVRENQNHPLFDGFIRRFRAINAYPDHYLFHRKFRAYKERNEE